MMSPPLFLSIRQELSIQGRFFDYVFTTKKETKKRRGWVVSPGLHQPGSYFLQSLTMILYCPDLAWTLSLRSSKSHERRQAGRRLITTQGSSRCMSNIKGQKRTGEWRIQEVEVPVSGDSSKRPCSNRVLKKNHSDWSEGKDTQGRDKSLSSTEEWNHMFWVPVPAQHKMKCGHPWAHIISNFTAVIAGY